MFGWNNLNVDNLELKKLIESLVDKVVKTPKKIIIRSGCIVDSVQIEFKDKTGYRIGGIGGSAHEIVLGDDEVITECCGTYSTFDGVDVIAYLKFITSDGRTLASHSGVEENMDFSIKGSNLTGIRGEEAVNVRGSGIYVKKIYADETNTELLGR